jgi:MFS transporter, FSR family, fosmidomycin resistance protein
MTVIAQAEAQNTLKQDSMMMALVGSAHFVSHFFQLTLPPLFPLLHATFDVSYKQLGLLLTVFYLVSGTCQAFAGHYVDKYGSKPVLMFGIVTMATCIGLLSLTTHFWMFYPLMALAGLGNGVFHPADLSALSHQVSKKRLGRAYSIHAAMGRFGFATGPLVVGAIAAAINWRVALGTAGLLGWAVAAFFFRYTHLFNPGHGDQHPHLHMKISYRQIIAMPAILLALGYFFFTTAAGSGFQAFSSVSFVNYFQIPLASAAAALATFLMASASGMLAGGFVADHTHKHVAVAVTGLAGVALCMFFLSFNVLTYPLLLAVMIVAGLCEGITAPSRDILIKGSAPPGATGRVFGFVYSGVDAGAMAGPLLFGAFVDAQVYHMLFITVALFFACGVPFVIPIGKHQHPVAKTA